MGLRKYIVKRTIYTIILIYIVLTVNFIIFQLMPADPVTIMASSLRLKPEQAKRLVEIFGLNEPLYIRYLKYIKNMFLWEFGYSYYSQHPVINEIMERLPNTILLLGVSTIFSIIFGVFTGVYAAAKRGEKLDLSIMTSSLIISNLPVFWTGMIFLYVFGFIFKIFPFGGTISPPSPTNPLTDPLSITIDILWHLFLPGFTLFLFSYGAYTLLMRSTMIESLTEDYITTARAKGVDERTVLFKHAFRNASLPLVTNIALSFASIISGAIATETVFSWHGMGLLTWDAVMQADYPVLQAIFYIFALSTIFANFIADILYGFIDPRIKYE